MFLLLPPPTHASAYSSFRAWFSHHLLQEDYLNCLPFPTLADRDPSSGVPQPLGFSHEFLLPPKWHSSYAVTQGRQSTVIEIVGSEVSHISGTDLTSLNFCFLFADVNYIYCTGLQRGINDSMLRKPSPCVRRCSPGQGASTRESKMLSLFSLLLDDKCDGGNLSSHLPWYPQCLHSAGHTGGA